MFQPILRHEPGELLVIGETNYRDRHERFGLLPADRLRHVYVIGKTGSGKSTLIEHLIRQDIIAGRGFALLDPHGELIDAVIRHVPRRRAHDIVLFRPSDTRYPIAFNVFRQTQVHEALLASRLISVFKKFWADSWGPRLEHILRNGILAIARDPRATLVFLYRFLSDKMVRESLVDRIADPVVRLFWKDEFARYGERLQAEALAPVQNKLGAFVSNPVTRAIVGGQRSKFDVADALDKQRVILADLGTGALGEDASRLLGGLLLSSIELAATTRGRNAPLFTVYVDEFQRFAHESMATMLSEARKFGLSLVLAHQYLSQLPETIRDAVIGNVGTLVVFRVGANDAEILAEAVGPPIESSDLERLSAHRAVVRLLAHGRELDPFTARMLPPAIPHDEGREVVRLIEESSRRQFALPRDQVERQIADTLGVQRLHRKK